MGGRLFFFLVRCIHREIQFTVYLVFPQEQLDKIVKVNWRGPSPPSPTIRLAQKAAPLAQSDLLGAALFLLKAMSLPILV